MNSSLTRWCGLALISVACTPIAFAQVTPINTFTSSTFGSPGTLPGSLQYYHNTAKPLNATSSHYSGGTRADIAVRFDRADTGTYTRRDGVGSHFRVGEIPVRISNLTFAFDGKWVNAGGDTKEPDSFLTLHYSLREIGNPTAIYGGSHTFPVLDGNGLALYDWSTTFAGSYILNPRANYSVDFEWQWGVVKLTEPTQDITVIMEAGGPFSGSTFDGLTFSFDHEPVPEPATLSLVVAAAALARRRRSR